MINKSDLINRNLLLILIDDSFGEVEGKKWPTFRGIIEQEGEKLFFTREERRCFEITEEWQSRIEEMNDIAKETHSCDYSLILVYGDISEDDNSDDFINTGLNIND